MLTMGVFLSSLIRWDMSKIFAITVALASPALADWQTHTNTDRMTDRQDIYVTVDSSESAAKLRISCYPSMLGRPAFLLSEIIFDQPIGFGEISMTYRFDQKALEPRILAASSSGREVRPWLLAPAAAAKEIARSKRLRAEIFPIARASVFLDFDLTGADKAIAQIRCH
jgi:hypothetical protein